MIRELGHENQPKKYLFGRAPCSDVPNLKDIHDQNIIMYLYRIKNIHASPSTYFLSVQITLADHNTFFYKYRYVIRVYKLPRKIRVHASAEIRTGKKKNMSKNNIMTRP